MSATYDPTLPTDRDWVRFSVGDRVAPFQLQDEEIDALLVEEANQYLAAARALEATATRWMAAGAGVVEKQVGELRIKRTAGQSAAGALEARIGELRARGAARLSPRPSVFRVL